jgi:diguanylate cyclase (GGDEF)-like protein
MSTLLDRERFMVLADHALARPGKCALLLLDVDNLRLINSTRGHRAGDAVLSSVGRRIAGCAHGNWVVGRLGADEFGVLITDLARTEDTASTVERLLAAVARPATDDAGDHSATCALGASVYPDDGADLDALLTAAAAALRFAKKRGPGSYALHTPLIARALDLRVRLAHALLVPDEAKPFSLVYQPLVALDDGRPLGLEAFLRWTDPQLGAIAPAEFIHIAEDNGLIDPLGDWILAEVCGTLRTWQDAGIDALPVTVNLSSVQLRRDDCVDRITGALARFAIAPDLIEIDLAGTAAIDLSATAADNAARLHGAGIRVALDDFGVGFSSLAHLRDLRIARIKIDRSFTVECMRDARTLTIVKSAVDIAHFLGIHVSAEGVETQAQQTWMQHLGCDAAQGYLFARPMSATEVAALLRSEHRAGRLGSMML